VTIPPVAFTPPSEPGDASAADARRSTQPEQPSAGPPPGQPPALKLRCQAGHHVTAGILKAEGRFASCKACQQAGQPDLLLVPPRTAATLAGITDVRAVGVHEAAALGQIPVSKRPAALAAGTFAPPSLAGHPTRKAAAAATPGKPVPPRLFPCRACGTEPPGRRPPGWVVVHVEMPASASNTGNAYTMRVSYCGAGCFSASAPLLIRAMQRAGGASPPGPVSAHDDFAAMMTQRPSASARG
jgi:hypothetical protein